MCLRWYPFNTLGLVILTVYSRYCHILLTIFAKVVYVLPSRGEQTLSLSQLDHHLISEPNVVYCVRSELVEHFSHPRHLSLAYGFYFQITSSRNQLTAQPIFPRLVQIRQSCGGQYYILFIHASLAPPRPWSIFGKTPFKNRCTKGENREDLTFQPGRPHGSFRSCHSSSFSYSVYVVRTYYIQVHTFHCPAFHYRVHRFLVLSLLASCISSIIATSTACRESFYSS